MPPDAVKHEEPEPVRRPNLFNRRSGRPRAAGATGPDPQTSAREVAEEGAEKRQEEERDVEDAVKDMEEDAEETRQDAEDDQADRGG